MAEKINRKRAELRLIMRAWKDLAFRRELLEAPKATMERELGVKFAGDAEVVIHQETPKTLHLVLPVRPETRLADADVEGQETASFFNPDCDEEVLTEPHPFCLAEPAEGDA